MSEYLHVEKPFLHQLRELGWTVIDQGQGIPGDPAGSLRSTFREVILPEIFREAVRNLNLTGSGDKWLTDKQIADLHDQISRMPTRSLLEANEATFKLLMKAQVDQNEVTGEADPTVKLIEFQNPERNVFHAINQFRIDTPGCVKQCIIPDVVLFVNGIPLVVVEAKIGDPNTANPIHAAFEQLLRYRNGRKETHAAGLKEGEPRLFYTNALLVRTCGEKAEFGTISSGHEHFYAWKDIWPENRRSFEPPLGVVREQEKLVQGLLAPETLLEVIRTCTVFMDTETGSRVKVVARYQQYRAARKIADRLREGMTPEARSGVVWHTQGSGKSLTMVFVARMIRASRDLSDHKLILVNDRIDLEEQLTSTAKLIGGKINIIENTAELKEHLSSNASDVNMVMIHKFTERKTTVPNVVREALASYGRSIPSGQSFGVVNRSERILLMVDEAHRTQGSDMGNNLFEAFPRATRIAFTGTPLITETHGHKRTVKRFGEYIDTYRLMDAVEDGATLQIVYEGRTAETALRDKTDFDDKFEDLFRERTDEEIALIKKKYGTSGDVLEAEKRIEAIAKDLVKHYIGNILPDGFKAQVVCHSKLAAIRYQKAIRKALADRLDKERLAASPNENLICWLEFLKVAVVLSADTTNELAAITAARKETHDWDAVTNFCRPFDRENPEKALTGIGFLVVCDMLLTGFDAPIEQVMYVDKRLREHNLLQAIARVNRVARNKHRGFIIDYIGLANHLKEALAIYSQADQADWEGGLQNLLSEVPILEERYRRLIQFFQDLGVAQIESFVNEQLATPADDVRVLNDAIKALKPLEPRANFDVFLSGFLQSLNLILPNESGHPFRGPARRFGYLLRMVKERYKDDSIDLAGVGEKVRALINEHLVELGINPKIRPTELLSPDFLAKVQQHSGADPESKASEMEHAIRKHCTVHLDEDPAFYARLSEKLEKLIKEHKDNWDELAKEYEKLREEAMAGRIDTIQGLNKEGSTFYEFVVGLAYGKSKPPPADDTKLKSLIVRILEILQDTIGIIDFWKKPTEIRRLRGNLGTEIALADIPALDANHERISVEIVKLAERRHKELLK